LSGDYTDYDKDNENYYKDYAEIHASRGIRTQIPAFERAKRVHGLDCAATMIGEAVLTPLNLETRILVRG
jgi:hypothetical protein